MFHLLPHDVNQLLCTSFQSSQVSLDWPVHQGVRSEPILRFDISFERRDKPNLWECKELEHGSIRGVLIELDSHPLCRILKGLCSRSKDGFIRSGEGGEGEEGLVGVLESCPIDLRGLNRGGVRVRALGVRGEGEGVLMCCRVVRNIPS